MSTHHDDFWGKEATWSSRRTTHDDLGTDPIRDTEFAGGDAGSSFGADRTSPIAVVRTGWRRLLSSGANPTREHGIERPAIIPDEFEDAVSPAAPAAISQNIPATIPRTIPDDIDATTQFGTDRDFDLERDLATPWDATMFDDLDDDEYDDHIVAAAPEVPDRTRIDPLVARLGVLAVISTLLVPLLLGFGGSDGGGDAVQTASEPTGAAPVVPIDPLVAETSEVATTVPLDALESDQVASTVSADTSVDASDTPAASGSSAAASDTEQAGTLAALEESTGSVTRVDDALEVADAAAASRVEPVCAIDYEVVTGDFWIRIADGAGVELAELLEANGASSDTPLFPGRDICLPAGSTIPAAPTTTAATVPSTTDAPTTTAPPAPAAPTTAAPTTTDAPSTTLPSNSNASEEEVKQIIRDVWPDELEERAIEIAARESRFVPTARNFCCHGVFQIYFSVHKSWLADLGVTSAEDLYDPAVNTRAAYTLYQRAGGWGPWGF